MKSVLVCGFAGSATQSGYDALCRALERRDVEELRTPRRFAAGPEDWVPGIAKRLGARCPDIVDRVRCITRGPKWEPVDTDEVICIAPLGSAALDAVVDYYARKPVRITVCDPNTGTEYDV